MKKALDHYDGSLIKEAKEWYTYLSDCAKKLDQAKKDKVILTAIIYLYICPRCIILIEVVLFIIKS